MFILKRIVAAVVSATLLSNSVSNAESIKREPVDYVSVIKDAEIHTPSNRVHSHSKFDITFALHDGTQQIRLALEPNIDLIPEGFKVTMLNNDGSIHSIHSTPRSEHKIYRGRSYIHRKGEPGWSAAGWARIMVHQDGEIPVFDGAFRIDGNNHHIETASGYTRVKHEEDPEVDMDENTMVVWRDSDVQAAAFGGGSSGHHTELKRNVDNENKSESQSHAICEADTLDFNNQYDLTSRNFSPLQAAAMDTRTLFGRQAVDGGGDSAGNLISSIGSIAGCPTSRKVALVGVATDCNYWKRFFKPDATETAKDIQANILNMVNKASELYESTFKISLAVKELSIQRANCTGSALPGTPWSVDCADKNFQLGDRLSAFSKWRGEKTDTNAYWTLMTTCATESAVGLAWRGQLCRQGSSPNGKSNQTIASANVVVLTSTEWQVFAHETGHTFGAVHDCVSSACSAQGSSQGQDCCPLSQSVCDAGGKFIMNPSTGPGITAFSACSIGNICSGLKGNIKSDCLTDNKNVELFSKSVCGNGIVEPGEDCDCGGGTACVNSNCCDSKTCKFKSGAVCDPANEDCCSDKCSFASSDKVCRASTSLCDPEERCTGTTSMCPEDKHKSNGESCGTGLECTSGSCTSRDRQCQVLMGGQPSGKSSVSCASECLMQCETPGINSGVCTPFNQYFLDGTSCSGGGRCKDGNCQGGSWVNQFTDWYKSHLQISIPVTVVVGIIILAVISSCVCGCFRRGRRRTAKPKSVSPPADSWQSYRGDFEPRPGQGQQNLGNQNHPNSPYGQQPSNNNNHQAWDIPHPAETPYRTYGQSPSNANQQRWDVPHPNENNNHNNFNMQNLNHAGSYGPPDHMYPPPPPPPPPAYTNSRGPTRYA